MVASFFDQEIRIMQDLFVYIIYQKLIIRILSLIIKKTDLAWINNKYLKMNIWDFVKKNKTKVYIDFKFIISLLV